MHYNIHPARHYNFVDDLWIISCIFNSNNYRTKPVNYDMFIRPIEEAGLHYLIIDCAFGNQPFNLPKSKNVLRIRTPHVLWQKERLLNIAIDRLPLKCKKVAWVDCDVLFENPDWAVEISARLKHFKIIQPFKEAIRLPKNTVHFSGEGDRYLSFAYQSKITPNTVAEGRFDLHGHTGFAWAASKSLLQKYGIYDACIAGTADHVMAHAFVGDWDSGCMRKVFGNNHAHFNHYTKWAKRIYPAINSKIDYLEGTLLHLWHGEVEDRKYTDREKVLQQLSFNPNTDIVLNKYQCWNWGAANPKLKKWSKEYFVSRKRRLILLLRYILIVNMYDYKNIKEVHLEITSYCNASCPQCSRNVSGGPLNPNLPLNHLSLRDCKVIFPEDFVKQLRTLFICGNYGDAMMAPELLEILEYFRNCNPKLWLSIHTNGSGRDEKWWQRLAKIITTCKFAIDGLEDTNHLYRKGTSWKKIMAGVQAYIGAGGSAQWEFIVFKHNQHQVEEAFDMSKTLGFKKFNVKKTERFFSPGMEASQIKTSVVNKSMMEEYTIQPPDDPRYMHLVYPDLGPEVKNEAGFRQYLEATPIKCSAVEDARIYVSAEGLVFPCCYLSNIYRAKNYTGNLQVIELLDALPKGKASVNGKYQSIEDIISSELFATVIPGSWEKKSFNEGKLYTCARTCGTHKFCSTSETKQPDQLSRN